eukprot:gene11954-biopygen15455
MRCCRRWRNGGRDGRVGRVGREGGGGGGAVVEESAAPDGELQPDGSTVLATRRGRGLPRTRRASGGGRSGLHIPALPREERNGGAKRWRGRLAHKKDGGNKQMQSAMSKHSNIQGS